MPPPWLMHSVYACFLLKVHGWALVLIFGPGPHARKHIFIQALPPRSQPSIWCLWDVFPGNECFNSEIRMAFPTTTFLSCSMWCHLVYIICLYAYVLHICNYKAISFCYAGDLYNTCWNTYMLHTMLIFTWVSVFRSSLFRTHRPISLELISFSTLPSLLSGYFCILKWYMVFVTKSACNRNNSSFLVCI